VVPAFVAALPLRPGFAGGFLLPPTTQTIRPLAIVSPGRLPPMRSFPLNARGRRVALMLGVCALLHTAVRAEWRQDATSLAWIDGSRVVWAFNFEPTAGKPYFHPLTVGGETPLTESRPADHPWHYGLWLSWKLINGANYWEEDRTTGRPEGATHWSPPVIELHPDGRATIRLELTYTHPSGRVDLVERRELCISAPAADGSYAIDWTSHFTAGSEGALLDRTPMPGEPNGRVNGGYAGLGLRAAPPPLAMSVVTTNGAVTSFEQDRARPAASALACNITDAAGVPIGGIAIFSNPANAGENAPWYVASTPHMRFTCAAVLAPKPIALAPGATLALRYRIALRRTPWTPEALAAMAAATR
jgi:hypothetical protein